MVSVQHRQQTSISHQETNMLVTVSTQNLMSPFQDKNLKNHPCRRHVAARAELVPPPGSKKHLQFYSKPLELPES